jgi:6-phosphogluconate dehydrogenase
MSNKHTHEIGVVGLGRMGLRLSMRLRDLGYRVLGYDLLEENRLLFREASMMPVSSLEELCSDFKARRIVILMVPAGKAVDEVIGGLVPFLEENDVLLDCGNSYYEDAVKRSKHLSQYGIHFLDVGVSGGVSGARSGACLTIGGSKELFNELEYLFKDISAPNGYSYIGPTGWGHLVKTIHNGIEYGFLQALSEGLHVIKEVADHESISVDLANLCEVWSNGSIIESRLMRDAVKAMQMLSTNSSIQGKVGGGETGAWAQKIACEYGVSVPVLSAALEYRKTSQHSPGFTGKVIAAVRNVFGEHELSTED